MCPMKGSTAETPGMVVQTIQSGKLRGGETAGTNCIENGLCRVPIDDLVLASLTGQGLADGPSHGCRSQKARCRLAGDRNLLKWYPGQQTFCGVKLSY